MDDIDGKESCSSATSAARTRPKRNPKQEQGSSDYRQPQASTDEGDSKFSMLLWYLVS